MPEHFVNTLGHKKDGYEHSRLLLIYYSLFKSLFITILISIIVFDKLSLGNLTENAMDSLNEKNELPKELSVGIYTKPHAMIITVDDTGTGIPVDTAFV